MSCCQQQLEIVHKIDNHLQQGYAVQGLGSTLFDLGIAKGNNSHKKAALNYLDQSLESR
ncbi:hypothetical protein [Pseudanabaena mucicola]|uniref:hypothetical protein n=1 Tax=Pseudanabaena mucicola TaxID=71190 RepID=UPI0033073E68